MSAAVTCKSCAYWCPPDRVEYRVGNTGQFGQCRRFPPENQVTDQGRRTLFPMTLETWWCGEHATMQGKPA